MNIVLCCDETYAPYCAVVMVSTILHTVNPHALRFFVLTPGLQPATVSALSNMVREYGAQLNIISAESKLANDNIDLQRFGPSSVMRLSLHEYLPPDCDRAIYLDCDLLVLDDIQELWEYNLNCHAVGAVTDLSSPSTFSVRAMRWPKYCNSGVLLIDLELWRSQRIGEKALTYIRKHAQELVYFDQDALNDVLSGRWQSLDLAWNFQSAAYRAYEKEYDYLVARRAELRETLHTPKIVHFIGGTKPWHADCEHPLRRLFIHFSGYTPWPIDAEALHAQLPLGKRLRLAAKALKTGRRRKMLRYKLRITR